MDDSKIVQGLRNYIADEILEGNAMDLDASTQLLELGILNSMEILGLIGFIEKEFGVGVPGDKVLAENFTDLTAITKMIVELEQGSA